jgi:hypothetical protein
MFKVASIVMAADGDPDKHRAKIKTSTLDLTVIAIKLLDFDQAIEVAKDMVQNHGVQSIYLCAGFTSQAVGRIASAVGDKVAVQVARGDSPTTTMVGETLTKEGWFS